MTALLAWLRDRLSPRHHAVIRYAHEEDRAVQKFDAIITRSHERERRVTDRLARVSPPERTLLGNRDRRRS